MDADASRPGDGRVLGRPAAAYDGADDDAASLTDSTVVYTPATSAPASELGSRPASSHGDVEMVSPEPEAQAQAQAQPQPQPQLQPPLQSQPQEAQTLASVLARAPPPQNPVAPGSGSRAERFRPRPTRRSLGVSAAILILPRTTAPIPTIMII